MVFLLLFQVKHMKLNGFFSWVGWLVGWQYLNSNQPQNKEELTFWQIINIILDLGISFIERLYTKIEGKFIFFEMSEENIIATKWLIQ